MSAMSNYLENKLVDHIFRGVQFSMPSTLYVGLFPTATPPSDSTTGASGNGEIAGNGYGRAVLAPTTANWAATNGAGTTTNPSSGTGGATSNNGVITFPTPSNTWGQVTHFGIFDAQTGGNMLFHGQLSAGGKTVNANDTVTFPAGQLQITFD